MIAGVVVFLVALPLCLGIALASNAPIISGLIAGIIAGIVISPLSGSALSVSGPAAGLAVIVASAIATLGSFELFLVAVFLSGLMQLLFGLVKAGTLSAFFPNSVIRGMLAAIGVTIILKQIPHGLGRDTDYEGDQSFWSVTDQENTLSDIGIALESISPLAILITLLGILTLIYWPAISSRVKLLEVIPGALVAVLLAVLLNELSGVLFPAFQLRSEHLVSVPETSLGFFLEKFHLPTLENLLNQEVLLVAVTLAIVGSIETLLSLEATDRLDPKGRFSQPNRELLAQGIGNTLCGLFGGLPMTAVIVRSSANVYAGAQSRWSSFFHGVLLLVCVALLTPLLNRIPLASLAAILMVVGYKLTSPAILRRAYRSGPEDFIPFAVTILAVIFTDLLRGVFIGLGVAYVLLIITSVYGGIVVITEGKDYFIQFTKDITFSNKAYLRKVLNGIPKGATVYIDGTKAMFINTDIYEMIAEFKMRGRSRDVRVELLEVRGKNYKLVTTKKSRIHEKLSKTTPTVQPSLGS